MITLGRRNQIIQHVRRAKEGHGCQPKTVSSSAKPMDYVPEEDLVVLKKYGAAHMVRSEHVIKAKYVNKKVFDSVPNPRYIDFTAYETRAAVIDSEEDIITLINELYKELHKGQV